MKYNPFRDKVFEEIKIDDNKKIVVYVFDDFFAWGYSDDKNTIHSVNTYESLLECQISARDQVIFHLRDHKGDETI